MIGIDISDRSVKIVQLSDDGPRFLSAHCWRAMPEGSIDRGIIKDKTTTSSAIKAALEQCRLEPSVRDAVVASIPETQSFLRVIEVPNMSEDEVGEAVQWEVAQHIPFGLENVYIDWQPVGGGHRAGEGRREVLVGAAQRQVVDPLVDVLQSLDLDVAALELESQAIVRALISSELRSKQGLLVVDLGGSATNVIIHDHGAMRFTAGLPHGSHRLLEGLSKEQRELLSVPSADELEENDRSQIADRMRAAQEELVMDIRGIVAFYNGIDAQHEVKEVLLTGGGSNLPGLDSVVLRFFDDVHVQRGNPWANVLPAGKTKKTPISLRESVHFSTALGLALRSIDS